MSTIHNEAKANDYGKICLMAGDPLRAKWIATTFLKKPKLINRVRGMLAYTGTYKGKRISVMGHGMGMPSMGIYVYELYNFFGVEGIIRVGSSGGIEGRDIKVGDLLIGKHAYTESNYLTEIGVNTKEGFIKPYRPDLTNCLIKASEKLKTRSKVVNVHSHDAFYQKDRSIVLKPKKHVTQTIDMETGALFAESIRNKKDAAVILTCTDVHGVTEKMSHQQREVGLVDMALTALEAAVMWLNSKK